MPVSATRDANYPLLAKGVNLTGEFGSFSGERCAALGAWDRLYSATDLNLVEAYGLTHVRLPVNFDYFIDPLNPSVPKQPAFGRFQSWVTDFIKYTRLGLVIDPHMAAAGSHLHYASWVNNTGGARDNFVTVYAVMAAWLATASSSRIFLATGNEAWVAGWTSDTAWVNAQETLAGALRAAAPLNTLVISARVGDEMVSSLNAFLSAGGCSDPNRVIEFHFYRPMAFTHQGVTGIADGLQDIIFPYREPDATNNFNAMKTKLGAADNIQTADVDVGNNRVLIPSVNWANGTRVQWLGSGMPAPFNNSSVYYVRALGGGYYAFYSTLANAQADTGRIDITTTGTGPMKCYHGNLQAVSGGWNEAVYHTSYYGLGHPLNADTILWFFQQLATWAAANGEKLWAGEYGVVASEVTSRSWVDVYAWALAVNDAALTTGIALCWWNWMDRYNRITSALGSSSLLPEARTALKLRLPSQQGGRVVLASRKSGRQTTKALKGQTTTTRVAK